MKSYWLKCNAFVVEVETDDLGVITKTPPIVRKFLGEPVEALMRWMRKSGGFECRPLNAQMGLF